MYSEYYKGVHGYEYRIKEQARSYSESASYNAVFRCYRGGLGEGLTRNDDFRSYEGVNPRIRGGIRVVRLFWDATRDNGEAAEL
jgi:hypothetical protein